MPEQKKVNVIYDDSPVDVSNEVNFIWAIANSLRGPYSADKYKDVIIPMTIIRRFECALAKTKDAVVKQFKEMPDCPADILCDLSGYSFYNTSEFTLQELTNDSDHLSANFKNYLNGFSENVRQILANLGFDAQIKKMDEHDKLYTVVADFAELDLDPETVDNVKMGYIFEDLIRRFSENAEAGDHYTGRDIVKVMVSLILAEGCDDIFDNRKVITICDQAAGTGGMLSTAYNFIKRLNPSAIIKLFSQEINPESYAECLAEMLIKGQDADNIKYANTFKEDCFKDQKMRFVLENPPFGTQWGGKDKEGKPIGDEKAVRDEHDKGLSGRWGAGLPSTSDGQMLFLQSAINKMDDHVGRAVIVENGSPLFTGGTASGESQIRRWILDQDLLEAIIALPTDLFYNTGIQTYLWVLSKNKRPERRGKVQLIDASGLFQPLRKALGNKRREITPENREQITKLYADFQENELCKIFDNDDFKYREYTVMQPLQRSYSITEESIERLQAKGSLNGLYDEAKVYDLLNSDKKLNEKGQKKLDTFKKNKPLYNQILDTLQSYESDQKWMSPEDFMPVLKAILSSVTSDKKLLEKIADGLSIMDKEAVIQKDKKGNIIYDKETKDTEIVPYKENIDDYMKREVLPYVPDAKAFWEENMTKKKPVIKTGAEIPFTRYFYKYVQPESSSKLLNDFKEMETSVSEKVLKLFGGKN